MSYKNIYLFFVILILLPSCGVKQVSTDRFVPIDNLSELSGRYINYNGQKYMSNILFEGYKNHSDNYNIPIGIIDLYFPTQDTISISFLDFSGYKTYKFKGQFKNNYFEYYLEKNRLYLPPFLMRHWISKRRIGKNKDGKLEIHEYQNNWGALFIICGGS